MTMPAPGSAKGNENPPSEIPAGNAHGEITGPPNGGPDRPPFERWLERIAKGLAGAAVIAALAAVMSSQRTRAGIEARLEQMVIDLARLQARNALFEQALDEKKQLLEMVKDRIEARLQEKQQQELALAEVVARWRMLEEKRQLLDYTRKEIFRRQDDLYELQRRLETMKFLPGSPAEADHEKPAQPQAF